MFKYLLSRFRCDEKMLEKLFGKRIRKGLGHVAQSIILIVVLVGVTYAFKEWIIDKIISVIPQPSNPELSTAYNNTITNVGLAFSITSIAPIIIIVGGIIAILMGYLYLVSRE